MKTEQLKIKDDEEKTLTNLNNYRLEKSKNRIAKAISELNIWTIKTDINREDFLNNIAEVVNLLDVSGEELKWHCDYFKYNDDICFDIDNACLDLGNAMSILFDKECEDIDEAKSYLEESLVKLSKIFATLILWNKDIEEF